MSNCLPGPFDLVLSHRFPGCSPPSPRCDPHLLLQNIWLFLWPHWNKLFSGSLFSHQHLPAQPACAHCDLPPISFSYCLQILPALWFWLGFFLPFANKGLLLCGYWIILQLFALCIFLPPTFSQLTFHRLCFYSFSLTSVGSVFIL